MGEILEISNDNFNEITADGVVVVDFYAVWCGPCKMMAPIFEEAAKAYDGRAVLAKVNVDENKELAAGYKVMSIPTLIFFKDGQAVDRISGVLDKNTLFSKIDALL